jgi:hypothetical protein
MLTMEFVSPMGRLYAGSAIVPGARQLLCRMVSFLRGGIDHWRLLQGAQGTMGIVTWANVRSISPQANKLFSSHLTDLRMLLRLSTKFKDI